MRRLGLLVAVEIEAVLNGFGELKNKTVESGFEVYTYAFDDKEVYVISSGAGQLRAAAATQLLISVYKVEAVFNFGVVGGLTPAMALASSCVVDRVVHYEYDTSALDHTPVGQYEQFNSPFIETDRHLLEVALRVHPELVKVTCASGDKFVDGAEAKQHLHDTFESDICEMEAAAIVLTCHRAGIPCLLIKTVSDALVGGADDFVTNLRKTSRICVGLIKQVIIEM